MVRQKELALKGWQPEFGPPRIKEDPGEPCSDPGMHHGGPRVPCGTHTETVSRAELA